MRVRASPFPSPLPVATRSASAWLKDIPAKLCSRPAFAAVSLIALVQAGALAVWLTDSSPETETRSQLTRTHSTRVTPAAGALLRIRFKPNATAAQINAALTDAKANIVAGPVRSEFYDVRIDSEARDSAEQSLRSAGIVEEMLPAN